jgi:hypothetical protein
MGELESLQANDMGVENKQEETRERVVETLSSVQAVRSGVFE